MRRGLDDEQWQETKREVDVLDKKTCCCCKVLSPGELMAFKRSQKMGGSYNQIDHAHRLPVSTHANLVYDKNNVFCLCREHHYRIDHYLDPVTGASLNEEQHENWWNRISQARRM